MGMSVMDGFVNVDLEILNEFMDPHQRTDSIEIPL